MIADGDPLVEVLEPPHLRRQLGRADQQQRDEEAVVGLEVEQQPQLLENGVVVDELRFVHDDDGVAPGLEVAKEDVVELMEQVGLRRTLRLDAELVEHFAQEIGRGPARVGQQPDLVALGFHALDERPRERRLAAAVLAGQQGAALPLAHRVHETDQGLVVLRRQIEELRVRRVVEGLLFEAPVRFVHGAICGSC